MSDSNFKTGVTIILFVIWTGVVTLLFWAHDHRDPNVVVIPTCAELNTYGYDGSISCVNEDGKIVRPGEN